MKLDKCSSSHRLFDDRQSGGLGKNRKKDGLDQNATSARNRLAHKIKSSRKPDIDRIQLTIGPRELKTVESWWATGKVSRKVNGFGVIGIRQEIRG